MLFRKSKSATRMPSRTERPIQQPLNHDPPLNINSDRFTPIPNQFSSDQKFYRKKKHIMNTQRLFQSPSRQTPTKNYRMNDPAFRQMYNKSLLETKNPSSNNIEKGKSSLQHRNLRPASPLFETPRKVSEKEKPNIHELLKQKSLEKAKLMAETIEYQTIQSDEINYDKKKQSIIKQLSVQTNRMVNQIQNARKSRNSIDKDVFKDYIGFNSLMANKLKSMKNHSQREKVDQVMDQIRHLKKEKSRVRNTQQSQKSMEMRRQIPYKKQKQSEKGKQKQRVVYQNKQRQIERQKQKEIQQEIQRQQRMKQRQLKKQRFIQKQMQQKMQRRKQRQKEKQFSKIQQLRKQQRQQRQIQEEISNAERYKLNLKDEKTRPTYSNKITLSDISDYQFKSKPLVIKGSQLSIIPKIQSFQDAIKTESMNDQMLKLTQQQDLLLKKSLTYKKQPSKSKLPQPPIIFHNDVEYSESEGSMEEIKLLQQNLNNVQNTQNKNQQIAQIKYQPHVQKAQVNRISDFYSVKKQESLIPQRKKSETKATARSSGSKEENKSKYRSQCQYLSSIGGIVVHGLKMLKEINVNWIIPCLPIYQRFYQLRCQILNKIQNSTQRQDQQLRQQIISQNQIIQQSFNKMLKSAVKKPISDKKLKQIKNMKITDKVTFQNINDEISQYIEFINQFDGKEEHEALIKRHLLYILNSVIKLGNLNFKKSQKDYCPYLNTQQVEIDDELERGINLIDNFN